MKNKTSIYWFRQDLRLNDNPALTASVKNGTIIPIYILDNDNSKDHKMGEASRLWLHYSLIELNKQLESKLIVVQGNPEDILFDICSKETVTNIFWNRVYEPWGIDRDKKIKENLSKENIEINSFNGSLLWEPWDALKDDGTPYRVFTPFFRRGCMNATAPRRPIPKPEKINYHQIKNFKSCKISDLNLLPTREWKDDLLTNWDVGEKGAQSRLDEFVENELNGYKEGRNFPINKNVSRLSPYLHWGEISPNTVWYKVKDREENGIGNSKDNDHFLSEIGWREFSNSLLFHFPKLPRENLQKKFDKFDFKKIHPAGSLGAQLKTVEDLMLVGKKIPFVDEGLKMKDALKILNKKKLGFLIVQNKKKITKGVITDGQIRRFNQKNLNINEMIVGEIMTKNPVCIDKNALAAKALSLMNSKKITSLCVYEKKSNFKTIGVLHIHNILDSNIS